MIALEVIHCMCSCSV